MEIQVKEKTKRCTPCQQDKPLSEFNNNRSNKDGKSYTCRQCVKKVRANKKNNIIAFPATGSKTQKVSIPKHLYTRPKQGKPLANNYELLDPKNYSKWIGLNVNNHLALEMANMSRLGLLGSRDGWHPREFHSAQAIGAYHNPLKDGADAHYINGTPIELKINWTDSTDSKLYGTGSFNDYTPQRFDRLYSEGYVLVSTLYIEHKLLAAIQLPLHWDPFKMKLESQLTKNGRVCLNFSASDWTGAPDGVKFLVKPSLTDLFKYREYIGHSLLMYMIDYLDNEISGKTSSDIF